MTVDSEAIFALVEHFEHKPKALRELHGTMAAGWLDERRHESLFLARGISRPLWLGQTSGALFFSSTRRALVIVEAALKVRLRVRQLEEGRLLEVVDGRIVRKKRFRPDRSYREQDVVSPVHSPYEAVSCLRAIAQITSAAG
jgi:asparagine synthetase B (glutamine-hydrolysing)